MAGYVGRLEQGQVLEAGKFLKGPWRSFQRVSIEAGQEHLFDGAESEYAIFVMSGSGHAVVGSQTRPATPGTALTVGYRASLRLIADSQPVEVFVTTLDVKI